MTNPTEETAADVLAEAEGGEVMCPNCGANAAHFIPPSLGDVGFFMCHDRDCALREDGGKPDVGQQPGCTCHLSKPTPESRLRHTP